MYKFAPAANDDPFVFGSARPGYENAEVNAWVEYMQAQGIQRVCCLLPADQLSRYDHLLEVYRQRFGEEQVCWAPIEDFHIASTEVVLGQILPFLAIATQQHEKVVVHCSGGIGRTGHVLAAWLVAGRGMLQREAIAAVRKTGKNPSESVIAALFLGRNPWKVAAELKALLDACASFQIK